MNTFRLPLKIIAVACAAITAGLPFSAWATIIGFSSCTGANSCEITTTPPNPIVQNPNNGILLAWDEVQNLTLTEKLYVDRVFDSNASFVGTDTNGLYLDVGTIVASHYFQWDPGNGSDNRVNATVNTDSQVFAFITKTKKLSDSDAQLGLPSLDYADFGLRGLESIDTTVFNGGAVDLSWRANSPGDWTRMITAFSPAAVVPVPAAVWLFGSGLLGLIGIAKRKKV